jgi:hypothetical protein
MNNYPTALLYSSKADGKGLGFTRLSTRITQQKEQTVYTALEGNPATARAMKSILQRALVVNNCSNVPWQSTTITNIHKEGWLSSLVQTLAETGKHLTLGGTPMANTVEQLLSDNNNLGSLFDDAEKEDILAAGITTVGDLTTVDNQGKSVWLQTNRLPVPSLAKITNNHAPPQAPIMLRAGQNWLVDHEGCNAASGQITEILGFTSTERDEVYIRVWENKLDRPATYQDVLTISQSTLSMGGGSNVVRKVSDLFVTEQARQVYMSHDRQGRGKQPRLYRTFMSSKQQLRPISRGPHRKTDTVNDRIQQMTEDAGLNRVKIYTDGSYTNNNHPLDPLLQSPDLPPPPPPPLQV